MQVLHVINSIGVREGAELSLIDIVAGTASPVLEHNVVVLDAYDPPVPQLDAAGITIRRPPTRLRGRRDHVRFVRAQVRSVRPDLVHSTLFDADLAARVAGIVERVPVLTSLVNMPYTDKGMEAETAWLWKLRAARMVDGVLARHATTGFHAITQAVADHAVERLGIDPRTIRIVPRGRSRERLGEPSEERRGAVRERLGWRDGLVLLNVARQEPQKGQIHVIDALPRIRREIPDVRMVIAGRDGRSSAELRDRIRQLGVEEHVDLLGVRDDVPDLMVGADLLVFPSLYEGLGGAVVEAMALDLGIVAFDTPAVAEALGGGRCGTLVPVGDTEGLARAVVEALASGDETEDRIVGARRRFESVYTLTASLDGMQKLYGDIAHALSGRVAQKRIQRLDIGSA